MFDSTAQNDPESISGPPGPLSRYIGSISATLTTGDSRFRAERFAAQAVSSKLFKQYWDSILLQQGVKPPQVAYTSMGYEAVCSCLWRQWDPDGVKVMHSAKRQRASYKGLVTCKSPWMCPVCMSALSEHRAGELGRFVEYAREKGCTVILGRFSDRHEMGEQNSISLMAVELRGQVDELLAAWHDMKRNRAWRNIQQRYGVDGPGRGGKIDRRIYVVRGFETTWGYNGWHPHLHPIFILAPGADVEAFSQQVRDLWYDARGGEWEVDSETGELQPTDPQRWDNGCYLTCNDGEVAEYITKYGHPPRWGEEDEVVRSASKRSSLGKSPHYTMMQLLYSYADRGTKQHGRLWVAFGLGMKGRNQLTWSPGAREWASLGEALTDDQVIEGATDELTKLYDLDELEWYFVKREGKRSELLEVADSGDRGRLRAWLFSLRVEAAEL